jgi:hypothetical protein
MNMISLLRRRVKESGSTTIYPEEYDQLQAEWITRVGADDLVAAAHAKGREEGLIAAITACKNVAEITNNTVGDQCATAIERLLVLP